MAKTGALWQDAVMTRSTEKGSVRRLYVRGDDLAKLDKAGIETGLSQTELLSQVVHAGLCALEKQGFVMILPLRFRIESKAVASGA